MLDRDSASFMHTTFIADQWKQVENNKVKGEVLSKVLIEMNKV